MRGALGCLAIVLLAIQAMQAPKELHTTVGMRVRIDELPLPGTELRAKPVADPQKAKVILRVLNVFPHGSGFRYNLEATPLVAGRLDLRDFLERKDGKPTADLPVIPLVVGSLLPPTAVEPSQLNPRDPKEVGGYRRWMTALAVLWGLGLLALIFVGRRRRVAQKAAEVKPPTLADRLRPLVEGAQAGRLDSGGRAELERLLLAHWRRRRNLEDAKVGQAIGLLSEDPEAGPLLRQLEDWLHRPAGSGPEVDLTVLLEPYRDVPQDDVRESA